MIITENHQKHVNAKAITIYIKTIVVSVYLNAHNAVCLITIALNVIKLLWLNRMGDANAKKDFT